MKFHRKNDSDIKTRIQNVTSVDDRLKKFVVERHEFFSL